MILKKNEPYSLIFKKVLSTSAVLNMIVILISFFTARKPLEVVAGILIGGILASYKVYTTFKKISSKISDKDLTKSSFKYAFTNWIGYILIISALIFGSYISSEVFIGVMAGVFNVYFSIFVYNMYIGIFRKRIKRNDDQ